MADLLAAAGGLTPSGNRSGITLIRDGTGRRIPLEPGAPALGGRIQPGDQLIVGRRGWISENMPVLVGATASVLAAAVTTLLVR
jgi:protein involved in polysaccharide export with SLBB domain